MHPRILRAMDYVESHLGEALTLNDIARQAHLSPYHFSRVFRGHTGMSPMQYVRRQRLLRAAALLRAEPQTPVGDLAFALGFESHQGFTAAFRRLIGVSPARYRTEPFPLNIEESLTMTQATPPPSGPEIRTMARRLVAGLGMDCDEKTRPQIPELWSRFVPNIGRIPGELPGATFGVCIPGDGDSFRYIAGVEVNDMNRINPPLEVAELSAGSYAVFTHRGSLAGLPNTMDHIFATWLPDSGYVALRTPDFELYDQRFDPATGTGELDIWVPLSDAPA